MYYYKKKPSKELNLKDIYLYVLGEEWEVDYYAVRDEYNLLINLRQKDDKAVHTLREFKTEPKMKDPDKRYYNLKDVYQLMLVDQRIIEHWELWQNHLCIEFTIPNPGKGLSLLNAAFQPRLEDEFY
jgi:hypothetical protein